MKSTFVDRFKSGKTRQETTSQAATIHSAGVSNYIMKKPNWQIKFRDLPEIPLFKKWSDGNKMTVEQSISFKLLNRQPISKKEEDIFNGLTSFYSKLNNRLLTLDYKSFSKNDFENFKDYIFYAFNYIALISNDLTIFQTYRLVVNEWVTGKNEPITDTTYLKYPSLDVVKKADKFNRANTPNTNVFYSTENIDTALKEIRPPLNKLVTVGVWKPNTNKKFISYPISHNIAIPVNEHVEKATNAFEELGNYNSSLFHNYMRYYFQLFGSEFTKQVNHHYEYYISALFSERIFDTLHDPNADFNYDCIIYPSVGNGYGTSNVAIRPSVIDNDFYLEKVIEFEVIKDLYDKPYVLTRPEIITLGRVNNIRVTNKIDKKGNISW